MGTWRLCRCKMAEVEAAKNASPGGTTIFGKIVRKEIKADILYEDDRVMAIKDANPQAPEHFLILPKKPIPQLSAADDSDEPLLGHMLTTARKVAKLRGLENGFRVVINEGRDVPSQCITYICTSWERDRCRGHQAREMDNFECEVDNLIRINPSYTTIVCFDQRCLINIDFLL